MGDKGQQQFQCEKLVPANVERAGIVQSKKRQTLDREFVGSNSPDILVMVLGKLH